MRCGVIVNGVHHKYGDDLIPLSNSDHCDDCADSLATVTCYRTMLPHSYTLNCVVSLSVYVCVAEVPYGGSLK